MIFAKGGTQFTATFAGASPGGLELGVRVDSAAGLPAIAFPGAPVTETADGYSATLMAPSAEGRYLVTLREEAGGDPLATVELQVTRTSPISSAAQFLPDVEDVAAMLTARTFGGSSDQEGEFNDRTRPTEGQVQTLIYKAANEVAARLSQEIMDETTRVYACEVVAVRAAMGVELSYYPEQTNADDSIYEHLQQLFETGMTALIDMLPDTSATQKGMYSLRMRSEIGGVLSSAEQIP